MHDTTQLRAASDRELKAAGQYPAGSACECRLKKVVRAAQRTLRSVLTTQRRLDRWLAERW